MAVMNHGVQPCPELSQPLQEQRPLSALPFRRLCAQLHYHVIASEGETLSSAQALHSHVQGAWLIACPTSGEPTAKAMPSATLGRLHGAVACPWSGPVPRAV
eukprot:9152701-Lingulodinium_polyedra.AAC.1